MSSAPLYTGEAGHFRKLLRSAQAASKRGSSLCWPGSIWGTLLASGVQSLCRQVSRCQGKSLLAPLKMMKSES